MRAPQILPWVAKQAGISEELALKLWRRAAGEAEILVGNSNSSDYFSRANEHFLALVEAESEQANAAPCHLTPAPRLTWIWQHQSRMSRLSMMAAEKAYRQWQGAWQGLYRLRKAA